MKTSFISGTLLFMAASIHAETQTVVTFDDGWEEWHGPTGVGGATTIEPEGGNPGAHARTVFNDFGISFVTESNPAFVGDFSGFEEITVSIDVKVEDISMLGNPVPRNLLVDFRSISLAPENYPWASVWYILTEMNTGDEWATYSVTFDPRVSELPPGWGGYGAEDPETFEPILPAGITFVDVMANTEALAFTTLEPGMFFAFTDHDVRVDNIRISAREPEPPPEPEFRLTLNEIHGGLMDAAAVASGNHVYVASGVLILAYDYTNPKDPGLLSASMAQPANGPISSLAAHGDYLYATWIRLDGSGGVNVYSLADPAEPELVSVIDDYFPASFNIPSALAVVDGYLYLNDRENGIFIANLDEPVALDFQQAIPEFNSYSRFFVSGEMMAASGRGFLGQTELAVFDVSDPAAPVFAGTTQAWGNTSFQFDVAGNLAVGVGTHLEVYDFSDPENIELRSSVMLDDPAPLGIVVGDHVYSGGFEQFQVWSIADPDAPVLVDSGTIDSFGMHVAAHSPYGPLVLSRRDRLLLLDTDNHASPRLLSDVYVPGGQAAMDVDFAGGAAFMLQADYGLTIQDAESLDLLAQFEADLPQIYQQRAMERIHVRDDHAFLASWGSGLVIADISDPANPAQTGLLEFPFLSAVEVRGDLAYFVTATNSGLLGIADVSDPAAPELISETCINLESCFSLAYDLALENDHAFIATSDGAMFILDVSNPAAPAARSVYDACSTGSGVDVDAKRSLAFLACDGGELHVIDISDLDHPTQVAIYHASDEYSESHSVKVRDGLAVFSHLEGVDLIDTADPASPVQIDRVETSWPPRNLVWHEDRIFAFTGPAGYYVIAVESTEDPDPPTENEIFRDAFEQLPDTDD